MKASSIKDELDLIASTITEYIISSLNGSPKELYQASSHYVTSGGKRLRPFMAIKSCEMLGGDMNRAIPAAAAVEMIHNFTLVHDDIMDNDDIRHGVPTVHKSFGTPLAILAGDILFSKAFQLLSVNAKLAGIQDTIISEMVARLAASCIFVCEGQATDVDMASNAKVTVDSQYINMIGKKTAALFEVSCALGALSAPDSKKDDIERLAAFGKNIGIAFQLIDDLIGIIGDPKLTGKAAGNDIREGKKTYPILLALKKAKGEDREKLLKVFGSKSATFPELKDVVARVSLIGIDKEVRDTAKLYMDRAIESLHSYKDSNAKDSLELSAKFIVERSL